METMDNIYVLNCMVNRQIRKGGKMVALFIDLRAAFDSVDRGVLIGMMKKKRIKEGLIRRVEEVLRKIMNRVRVGGELGKGFWSEAGMPY